MFSLPANVAADVTDNVAIIAEVRPRDFSARITRRANARPLVSIGPLARFGARRHRGRRLAILGAAIALPAMAAPGEWQSADMAADMATAGTHAAPSLADPRPAEGLQLAENSPTATLAPAVPPFERGPVAGALLVAGSGKDIQRAQQCMTMALYYEAATESNDGNRAVAQVVLNRVAHRSYPGSVCGVVFQGSHRQTGCQFSFTCDGSLARNPKPRAWKRASRMARAALAGSVFEPVGLATHYHTLQVNPYWSGKLRAVETVGAHRFYRNPGDSGRPAAYSFRYAGGEPLVAAYPGMKLQQVAVADPSVEIAQVAGNAPAALNTPSHTPSNTSPEGAEVRGIGGNAPAARDDLPQSGNVRAEFANSGKWLIAP